MLNREEYNTTFQVDLSAEEFARLKPIVLGSDNIKDVKSITAVIPNTLKQVEFVPVVRCKECKYRYDSLQCRMYSEGMETADNWFCADGERRDK